MKLSNQIENVEAIYDSKGSFLMRLHYIMFLVELYTFKKENGKLEKACDLFNEIIESEEYEKKKNIDDLSLLLYTSFLLEQKVGRDYTEVQNSILEVYNNSNHQYRLTSDVSADLIHMIPLFLEKSLNYSAEILNEHIKNLINAITLEPIGISWNHYLKKYFFYVDPPQDFPALGLDGISSIVNFLQIINQLQSTSLISYLINQAIGTQNRLFDQQMNNWPANKRVMKSEEDQHLLIDRYNAGDLSFFKEKEDDLSFRKGTIGIMFSSLIGYVMTKEQQYLDDYFRGLEKLISSKDQLLETYPQDCAQLYFQLNWIASLNNDSRISEMTQMLDSNLELCYNNCNSDLEKIQFLNWILKVENKEFNSSYFTVHESKVKFEKEFKIPSLNSYIVTLLEKDFERTMMVLDMVLPGRFSDFTQSIDFNNHINDLFIQFVSHLIGENKGQIPDYLQDVFKLEKEKYVYKKNFRYPHSYMTARSLASFEETRKISNLSDEDFEGLTLSLHANALLVENEYDWNENEDKDGNWVSIKDRSSIDVSPRDVIVSYDPKPPYIMEMPLVDYSMAIYGFQTPTRVKDVYDEFKEHYAPANEEELNKLIFGTRKAIVLGLQVGYLEVINQ